jgi:hypothetical protein
VLAVTGWHAGWLLELAHDLAVKLPAAAALATGSSTSARARIIAAWCPILTPDQARAVEAVVFAGPDVAEWTGPALRDRAARAVMEVSPDAARRQRERGAGDRRVQARPELSGNAMLAGRNHRDKQSPGWRLEAGPNRGEFRWTTASGRTYLSKPTQYPI